MDQFTGDKFRFFELYVQPLLKKRPKGGEISTLYDIAERAWRAGVTQADIEKVRVYLRACEKAYKENPEEFRAVLTQTLSDIENESTFRMNEAMKARTPDDGVRGDLMIYAAYVENFVRAFSTPLYYFTHVYYLARKGGPKTPEAYASVGLVPKLEAISNIGVPLPGIDLPPLVEGVDLDIRNGGIGHEHWSLLDDGRLEIKKVYSSTGEINDTIVLTPKELARKLKELGRAIWVLRAGFYIFLTNEDVKLPSTKPRTRYGVEHVVENWAENRAIVVKMPFDWDEENGEVHLTLDHEPRIIPSGGSQIFMPTGAYDVITMVEIVPYKFQILDVLKYTGMMIDQDKYTKIKVTANIEGTQVQEAVYKLSDIMAAPDRANIPRPIAGNDLDESVTITISGDITVPMGTKDEALQALRKQFPDRTWI